MKTKVGTMQVKEIANVLNNVGAGLKTETFIDGNVATIALTAEDSGKTILLNRAAGCDVTLPASTPGLTFNFLVIASVTSNDYSINGKVATDLFIGGVASDDTDTSNAARFFNADGSDDDVMSMNGTTTGGLIGSHFKVTCVAASRWLIQGVNKGSSTVATPFL
jgi:hypothetical protein